MYATWVNTESNEWITLLLRLEHRKTTCITRLIKHVWLTKGKRQTAALRLPFSVNSRPDPFSIISQSQHRITVYARRHGAYYATERNSSFSCCFTVFGLARSLWLKGKKSGNKYRSVWANSSLPLTSNLISLLFK